MPRNELRRATIATHKNALCKMLAESHTRVYIDLSCRVETRLISPQGV
jgi:hypothetical protein